MVILIILATAVIAAGLYLAYRFVTSNKPHLTPNIRRAAIGIAAAGIALPIMYLLARPLLHSATAVAAGGIQIMLLAALATSAASFKFPTIHLPLWAIIHVVIYAIWMATGNAARTPAFAIAPIVALIAHSALISTRFMPRPVFTTGYQAIHVSIITGFNAAATLAFAITAAFAPS